MATESKEKRTCGPQILSVLSDTTNKSINRMVGTTNPSLDATLKDSPQIGHQTSNSRMAFSTPLKLATSSTTTRKATISTVTV